VAAAAAAIMPAAFTPFEQPDVVAGQTFLSAMTKSVIGRVIVLAVSGLLGLSGVLAVWTLFSHRHDGSDARLDGASAGTLYPGSAGTADASATDTKANPATINRRWLPEQTQLLIDVRLSQLRKQPPALDALAFLGPWWQPSLGALLSEMNLVPEQVHRMTWASTDLANCSAHSVVVLELEPGIDAFQKLPRGEPVDLGVPDPNWHGIARRLARWVEVDSPYSGPYLAVAVDAHTIVTGSEEDLRKLVARGGDGALASVPMELLVKNLPPGELAVMVDLATLRTSAWKPSPTAIWKLPANLLDVWPAGKSSWRMLCDAPLAFGLSVPATGEHRCELGLVCGGETKAELVRSDVEKLVPAALQALPPHIAALKDTLTQNKVEADVANRYILVLNGLLAALRSQPRCDTADGVVWLRFGWQAPGLLGSAASFLQCKSARDADWLTSARAVDETRHRGLLGALLNYAKAQTPPKFPEATAGDVLLMEPETRLSWIANLLPYLGHTGADWHVEPGSGWSDAPNRQVTSRSLPEVQNPALVPRMTPSDYPVTHYAGLAGVGKDAAKLPANDPRAGVFGYGRQTRQQDLDRGGEHTIAMLGVQDQCGPWAQGGRATVRALTQQPYCNGPDGFGSGQPDGMLAGMADGSVRFLSNKIDPHVMEQLAEIRGPQVDMAELERLQKPPPTGLVPPVIAVPKLPVVPKVRLPAALPTVAPKPPVEIDPKLRSMLNVPIARIALPNVPLGDAVRNVAAVGNLSISFDPDAMDELGVSFRDPISIDVAGTSASKALEEIAARRNMALVVENGQVLLTSTAEFRQNLRQIDYAVSDLTGGDAKAATQLAALIERLVAPESWAGPPNGGRQSVGAGSMEILPDVLRIRQTGQVHYQITIFCEKLRVARGMKTTSRLDPKKFTLTTRTARAKAILGRSLNLNLDPSVPISLGSLIERFKQVIGCEILVDRPGLAAIGISEGTTARFKVEKLPLGEALARYLGPLDLFWRVVDANTLQVTTKKAIAERMELEFYPIGRQLGGRPPAALIEQIKAALHGAVWGEGAGAGALDFDPLSQCLIVRQSQPVQREIEEILGK
jgi:hypothetical protein